MMKPEDMKPFNRISDPNVNQQEGAGGEKQDSKKAGNVLPDPILTFAKSLARFIHEIDQEKDDQL